MFITTFTICNILRGPAKLRDPCFNQKRYLVLSQPSTDEPENQGELTATVVLWFCHTTKEAFHRNPSLHARGWWLYSLRLPSEILLSLITTESHKNRKTNFPLNRILLIGSSHHSPRFKMWKLSSIGPRPTSPHCPPQIAFYESYKVCRSSVNPGLLFVPSSPLRTIVFDQVLRLLTSWVTSSRFPTGLPLSSFFPLQSAWSSI